MCKFALTVLLALLPLSQIQAVGTNWLQSKRHGDVAYFLHDSTPRLEAYDLANDLWLTVIQLTRGTPTAFHVDESYLYIAYDRNVYRYDKDGENETHLGDFDRTVHGIFSEGDILFVNYSSGGKMNLDSLNRNTTTPIDTFTADSGDLLYSSHSPNHNKIYGIQKSGSPDRIKMLSYTYGGILYQVQDSPYNADYTIGFQTWLWPDGSRVTDTTGNIYSGETLSHLGTFAMQVDDLAFRGSDLPIVLTGYRITAFSNTLVKTGYKDLGVTPKNIYTRTDDIAVFSPDSNNPTGMSVQFVSYDELLLDPQAQPTEPTLGYDFYANAEAADDLSEYWSDFIPGNPSGLGLLLDKSTGNEVLRQPIPETSTSLTHAFQFPGGKQGNAGGARLVETNTSLPRSFDDVDWHIAPVTFELWLKPDNLNPTRDNGQILFEDGGGIGLGLFLNDNKLEARYSFFDLLVTYDISLDPDGLLRAPATEEFIQVVVTCDTESRDLQLFINGIFVGSDSGVSYWTGGDSAGFGTRGGSNTGGLGNGQSGTESFQGQIAAIRIYSYQVLTAEEVETNFLAIAGPDTAPPEIDTLSPATGSLDQNPGIGQLVATFTENLYLMNQGSVTLKNITANTEEVISLPSAAVETIGRDLVIHLSENLALGSQFAVQISNDAFQDGAGNLFAGISDDTTWTFTTEEENLNPPVITAQSPAHEEASASPGTRIVATFDQNLILGTGDVVIKDLLDGSSTQTIPVTDTSQVSLTNNVLTIDPAVGLETARSYAVLIPSTAVRNYSDVNFAGISSDTEWTFTTANLASQLDILDLRANGGINPATDEPWKAADRYRLVFISSTYVDPAAAAMDSIDGWNSAVQSIADAAGLGGVTWKIIGSTNEVDARDNTSTNPLVDGTGHAIFTMDGSSVIENDFVDLWDGNAPQNIARFDENSVDKDTSTAVDWPLTGTNFDGIAHSSLYLKDISGGGSIRQGRNQVDFSSAWIDANNVSADWTANSALSVYGMSEPLFIIDRDDDIAPGFISFGNDAGGSPVKLNDTAAVNYTVTFDEAMLPATVNASDFGNAGTAGFSIDSIAQQEDAAIFVVTVLPNSAGSLQLRIKQSAELTDLNGNPLDTSTGILDGTTITVEEPGAFETWSGGLPADGDANSDGVENAAAWVLGASGPTENALSYLPDISKTASGDLILSFRCLRSGKRDNAVAKVQYSNDLGIADLWINHEAEIPDVDSTVNGIVFDTTDAGDYIDVIATIPSSEAGIEKKLFGRFAVEIP